MIKLTHEHVGTRVLLSDDSVHFVTDMTDTHYWLTEAGLPDQSLRLKLDGLDDDDGPLIQCLLDAPNPLDVEVPEWCEDVVVWYHDEAIQILDREKFQHWRRHWRRASHEQPPQGWSPAPGQLPPTEQRGV